MPERVVDEFEVVQVEHDRCAPAAVARPAHPVGFKLALEAAAVEQARQRVVVSQVDEPLLGASALGDVLDLGRNRSGRASASRNRVVCTATHTGLRSA